MVFSSDALPSTYRASEVDKFTCSNLQIKMLEEDMFVAGDLDAWKSSSHFFSAIGLICITIYLQRYANVPMLGLWGGAMSVIWSKSLRVSWRRVCGDFFPVRLSSTVSLVKARLRTAIRSRPSLYQSEL